MITELTRRMAAVPLPAELNQARRVGVAGYALALWAGATHQEIMDSHLVGRALEWYAEARNEGASHNEAVLAWRTNTPGSVRQKGSAAS